MIVNKRVEGLPKSKTIEENANKFLLEFEKDERKEYLVRIDYASLSSNDCSVMGYFTRDEERLVFEGYKILDDE